MGQIVDNQPASHTCECFGAGQRKTVRCALRIKALKNREERWLPSRVAKCNQLFFLPRCRKTAARGCSGIGDDNKARRHLRQGRISVQRDLAPTGGTPRFAASCHAAMTEVCSSWPQLETRYV